MKISFAAERELIRRARSGDEQAFEELVKEFTPDLFRLVRRMVADRGEAEAAVQETFWRIWQALPRYREDRRFFPYLAAVAANLLRDSWRKERRWQIDELELGSLPADGQPTPERQLEEAETLQALAQAVDGLPASYRMAIVLRYDAGLSYEEIASALDVPVNSVRTLLHRAKQVLRRKLERPYD